MWSIIPGVMVFTSLFFLAEHMNYSFDEWILGNLLVTCFTGLIYGANLSYNKIKKTN